MKFKTSRDMRHGAALVKEWFVHSRNSHKRHLDWGRTTPSSIQRWLRVMEARKREYERLHPPERAHLRHSLLIWLDKVGDGGRARLLREWTELRGPTDAQRAAATAQRNVERLKRKHPLFAAMDALDEVVHVPTPESTLASLRAQWEMNREHRKTYVSSHDSVRHTSDPDAPYHDDRMSLNALRIWGRVCLMSGEDVDRAHLILAREVWLANSRDDAHMREMMGLIFYSTHAHGIESGVMGAPALAALRDIVQEVTGSTVWLDEYVQRGRRRLLERKAEQEEKRRAAAARFAPEQLDKQLVIPLSS